MVIFGMFTLVFTRFQALGLVIWAILGVVAVCHVASVRCVQSGFWPYVLACALCCRVGEAANPGPDLPTFTIGVFNPTGLRGKAPYIVSQLGYGDIWAISETHLCAQSFAQFRSNLHFADSPFRSCIGGHPVPAQTNRMYHTSWRGVAVLSKHPTRLVPTNIPAELLQSSRVAVTTTLMQDVWVTGGTVYGEPEGPSYPLQKCHNEALLHHVASHVCYLARGPRFVAGDWNVDSHSLPVFEQLEAAGFRELQDLALTHWGQPIAMTCKGVTRKDFCYVSPELQQILCAVHVAQDIFPDHAVLWGEFKSMGTTVPRQVWHVPQPFPWPDTWNVDPSFWKTHGGSCDDRYHDLWSHIESQAAVALPFPVAPAAKGRAATTTTKPVVDGRVPPPKRGPVGAVKPHFVGASFRHAQWLRQVRRLQSYVRYVQVHSHDTCHARRLWGSIIRSTGFHFGFVAWWESCACRTLGAPDVIPWIPPGAMIATAIFDSMQIALRQFELDLQKSSRLYAKLRRDSNPNAIFQDLRAFQPNGVDILLHQTPARIDEVRLEEVAVVLDRPVALKDDVPVVCEGRQLNVLHAEHDCIWLDSVDTLRPGLVVSQVTQIGSHADLSRMFLDTWRSMWERHRDVPVDRWQKILAFARAHLPRGEFAWQTIDVDALSGCIAHKSSTTTGGLDGVTLSDLKAVPAAALQNFVDMFHHAEQTGSWPSQVVAGRVSCLAKVPQPEKVLDFRPITVLGLLYRCWGTFHARQAIRCLDSVLPMGLYGSRPSRFAGQVWSHLLWSIEQAYECSIPLCGLVVDIQKAFNYLPREVVMEACAIVGLPFNVLRGWSGALSSMARRFMLNGSLSAPAFSDCGLPEGCALSCVGMMVIDVLFHHWMTHHFPLCQPLSYVDDWQVLLTNPALLGATFRCLEEFTQALDLKLDQRKSHSWSICASGRQSLRAQELSVVSHCKNLGAHVQISRQHTNSALMARVQSVVPLWPKLRLSACSYIHKLRALRSAAWPRALHGVAATALSFATFATLRAGAMRGLRADASGANPWVHLGLIESVDLDPFGWAILQTLRLTRDCGSPDRVEHVLAAVADGDSDIPANSITQTLCSRLQSLGWHVDGRGHVHDLIGPFSIFGISMAELRLRVAFQWPLVVEAQTQHRWCFQELGRADPLATQAWMKQLDESDRALFRKILNGSHITQDGKKHCQEASSDLCPFCENSDSRYHRFWECERFASLREDLDHAVWTCLPSLPEALTCSGWDLAPTTALEWNQHFVSLQTQPVTPIDCAGDLHLFTDGSCFAQDDLMLRFAGWAVVVASCNSVQDCCDSQVVASGVLPGLLQSSIRAEIFAIFQALQLADSHRGRLFLWTDCEAVVKKVRKLLAGSTIRINSSHADLWHAIRRLLRKRQGQTLITRVAAHQNPDDEPCVFHAWCYRHNGMADSAAVQANLARAASFWELHRRHVQAVTWVRCVNSEVHRIQLRISQEVVRHSETAPSEPVASLLPSAPFLPWTPLPELQLPAGALRWYGDELVRSITSWFWFTLSSATEPLAWIAHSQLYLDFQLATGLPGPIHLGKWRDGSHLPWIQLSGFSFKQRVRWFTKLVKEVLRHQQVALQFGFGLPESQVLQFHTGLIALPWPKFHLRCIDNWLLRVGGGHSCRRGAKALDALPFAQRCDEFLQVPFTTLGF